MSNDKLSLSAGLPDSGFPDWRIPEPCESDGKSFGQNRPDLRRFLFWWLIFALVIGFLGFLFDRLLVEFYDTWWEDWLKDRRTQAADLLASIQGEMQLEPVLIKVMRGFVREIKETRVTPETSGRLENRLLKRIPRNTQCYWFDEKQNLVRWPRAQAGGNRVWKALLKKLLNPSELSSLEENLAAGLMHTKLGSFATLEHLSEGVDGIVPVLVEGKRFQFGVFPMKAPDKSAVGTLLCLFPLNSTSPDWPIKRAIQRLSSAKRWVGGYRLSTGRSFGIGELNENLLVGLQTNLRAGINEIQFGVNYFRAQYAFHDQDMMIVAGIPGATTKQIAPVIVQAVRICLFLLIIVFATRIWKYSRGFPLPPISLSRKFAAGTLFLVVPPLLVMCLLALAQNQVMHRVGDRLVESELETALHNLEAGFSLKLSDLENSLRQLLRQPRMQGVMDGNTLKGIMERLCPFSGLRYTYIHRSGVRHTQGYDTQGAGSPQLAFMEQSLKSANFKLSPEPGVASKPAALANFLSAYQMQESKWESLLDRLELSQLGGVDFYILSSFAVASDGSRLAFLTVGLPMKTLRIQFLNEVCQTANSAGSDCRLFLQGEPGQSSIISNLLQKASLVGRPMISRWTESGKTMVSLARPVCSVQLTAMAVKSVGGSTQNFAGWLVTTGFVVVGLLGALGVAFTLRRAFLRPVLEITQAVKDIDRGAFPQVHSVQSIDELGVLEERLNGLVQGLKEKEQIAGFVRPDLLDFESQTGEKGVRREHVAVLFSGLRGFSRYERGLDPNQVFELLQHFHGLCEQAVVAAGGQIDKFMGDSALAVFFADPGNEQAVEAKSLKAAVMLAEHMEIWRGERRRQGLVDLPFGIGLYSGETLVGKIGSRKKRLDFTVIGDVVNVAARLEKLAGREPFPTILASGQLSSLKVVGRRWVNVEIETVRGRSGTLHVSGLVQDIPGLVKS